MTDPRAETEITEPAGTFESMAPTAFEADAGFDDGLVHDHGWACSERGAPAF